jgi:hypothetical protein
MNSVGSTLLAEAEALRDGVRLIPEGTQAKIVAETDSLELWFRCGRKEGTNVRKFQVEMALVV